jgi:hypothetical protein
LEGVTSVAAALVLAAGVVLPAAVLIAVPAGVTGVDVAAVVAGFVALDPGAAVETLRVSETLRVWIGGRAGGETGNSVLQASAAIAAASSAKSQIGRRMASV